MCASFIATNNCTTATIAKRATIALEGSPKVVSLEELLLSIVKSFKKLTQFSEYS